MEKLLLDLDKDIKRCDDVLIENNYLEIVIAVEELTDKYKNEVQGISNDNDKVWNYTKKDLIHIKEKLDLYKENFLIQYHKNNMINMFKSIKECIQNNEYLGIEKINEVIDVINDIENINNKDINKNQKWEELKPHLIYTTKQTIDISRNIIFLINTVLQFSC